MLYKNRSLLEVPRTGQEEHNRKRQPRRTKRIKGSESGQEEEPNLDCWGFATALYDVQQQKKRRGRVARRGKVTRIRGKRGGTAVVRLISFPLALTPSTTTIQKHTER